MFKTTNKLWAEVVRFQVIHDIANRNRALEELIILGLSVDLKYIKQGKLHEIIEELRKNGN
ncbi:MAG: hypothetical protein ACE5ES_00510 [Candidatus Nanoarchaeia archaeon]